MSAKENEKGRERTVKLKGMIGREEFHWADLVSMKYSEEKFLFTFAQFHPDEESYTIVSQIIIPPKVAMSFSQILTDAVKDYYEAYPEGKGKIELGKSNEVDK